MKKLGILIILLLLCVFLPVTDAAAGKQDFLLMNQCGFPLHGVYISHVSSDNWEENILNGRLLEHNASTRVNFPSSFGNSRYFDIMIKDGNGNKYVFRRMDLIDSLGIGLFYRNGRMTSLTITPEQFEQYLRNR